MVPKWSRGVEAVGVLAVAAGLRPLVQMTFYDYIPLIELLPNDLTDLPCGGWHATSYPELRVFCACVFVGACLFMERTCHGNRYS
jgi:hypothetical protein